jgi:heptosyltransferase-2
MKILVRAPNWIGDQVMAYPFFHFLRRRYPKAHIASVCVPWVQDLQFRNLVDEVMVVQPPLAHERTLYKKFQSLERVSSKLRTLGPWDLGISLPNSFGTAWMLWRAGVRVRRGYALEGRGFLLNDGRDWPEERNATHLKHRAQAYADLVSDSGTAAPEVRGFWGTPPENELDPWIEGELPAFPAEAAWPDAQPLAPPEGDYWVLAPGATADSRRWSEDQFAALARRVASETGWSGVIVGGPKEAPIAARLKEDRATKLKDWTARGPVTSLHRIFAGAKFTVTNESGLAHVASLCGSPVQIVCGAADPRRTKPIGPGRVQVTVNAVDCWPCEKNTCSQTGGRFLQCLKGIAEQDVWGEISKGLIERSSGTEVRA